MVKRIDWIDTAKGLGIFLVVLGHIPLATEYSKYFYMFHMPLFFFLSGLVFKRDKFHGFSQFIKNRSKSLLLPYLIFSLATYLFWLILGRHFGNDASVDINVLKPLIGTFYSVGTDGWLVHNVPLWFLTCLFLVESMFYWIASLKRKMIWVILGIASVVGYVISNSLHIRIFWSFDIALVATVFYGVGYLLKDQIFKFFGEKPNILIFIFLGLVGVLIANLNGYVDMNGNTYGNYFYYFIGGIVGISFCLTISKYFERVKIINFLGKNSLIIMALHNIALSFIKAILVFGFSFSLDGVGNSLFWSVSIAIAVMVALIPAILFINKFMPFILGKSGLVKKGKLINQKVS